MLIGNLGADPELKHGHSGAAVLRLRMATTERWVDTAGERQERTEWHTVIFFGNRAEGLAKHLEKGARVYVEGRLQTREYETKAGERRFSTEIVGTQLLFLGGGGKGGERSDGGERRAQHREEQWGGTPAGDDEIPF